LIVLLFVGGGVAGTDFATRGIGFAT
jgi:hypothetical protein